MDSEHFDHLARTLGAAGTRRRLLRLSALPLAGGLAGFLSEDERSAAKKKKHRKKRCKSKEEVCAGKCGIVTYKCHGKRKTVDCGACRCDVCASGCAFTSVQAAIDAADPGDTIRLCLETYTEDIEIDKDLTIVGSEPPEGVFAATFLQGTGANRVIDVHRGTVRLESLWITGGNGGISNEGTLTLHHCAILENTTNGDGGGIFNDGTLEMTSCFVMWNTADEGGGGIQNQGTLEMTNCTVEGNSSGYGGGINSEGPLTLTDSTISGNSAVGMGGGIFNEDTLTLKAGSTVTGNDAGGDGGGIYNNGASVTLTDSTLSGNLAAGDGGGIFNYGTATLSGSTVTGNVASSFGGGIMNFKTVTLKADTTVSENEAAQGGGIYNVGGTLGGTSTCSGGSSVSGNTPNNCAAAVGGSCDGC